MSHARCSICGVRHDLAEIQPRYGAPDPLLEIPREEWEDRARVGQDQCIVRTRDDKGRFFLRVLLPVPVHGRPIPCSWSVWVEVYADDYRRVDALWDDPAQAGEPPFTGVLVNELMDHQGTVGLYGTVQLTGPTTLPTFHLLPGTDHPLAAAQREGVDEARALRWAHMAVHS